MPHFTVRVELHDAVYQDYTTLHASMESAGFSRDVVDGDGRAFRLPLAEYDFEGGGATPAEVLALAVEAAAATRRRASVLVTEALGRAWAGLRER
jgi:hypothetical protein